MLTILIFPLPFFGWLQVYYRRTRKARTKNRLPVVPLSRVADVDDIDLNRMGWPICVIFLDEQLPARYNQPISKQVLTPSKKSLRGVNVTLYPAADLQAHGPQRRERSTAVTAILSNRKGF
jgi:hypothetical protein